MFTREQAADMSILAFHGPGTYKDGTCHIYRRNGRPQLWKSDKRKNDFRVPWKYGMWMFGNITPLNAIHFHVPEECPVNQQKERENNES